MSKKSKSNKGNKSERITTRFDPESGKKIRKKGGSSYIRKIVEKDLNGDGEA